MTSKASETGSTVGSRIATKTTITTPMRQFRRSCALVTMPSRTSASTKIGISKTRPMPSIATRTNVK